MIAPRIKDIDPILPKLKSDYPSNSSDAPRKFITIRAAVLVIYFIKKYFGNILCKTFAYFTKYFFKQKHVLQTLPENAQTPSCKRC